MRIRIHYSWIVAIAIVTSIVTTQFSAEYPLLQRVLFGLTVSLCFLIVGTFREYVLGTMTFRRETIFCEITCFFYGGVYQESKARILTPHLPLFFTARYLSNLVISVIFYGFYASLVNTDHLVFAGMTQWLCYIFFLLFLVNFLPVYPLDGGEILRLILWKKSGDYYKATQVASFIGWIGGIIFIFAGILVFINTQQVLTSLTVIAFGWMVVVPAGKTRLYMRILTSLQSIQARYVLTRDYPEVTGKMNIGQLIRENILKKGWRYVTVVENGEIEGILTLKQIKAVPEKHWSKTTVNNIMTPIVKIGTAHPLQTADTIFEEMQARNLNYMPVLEQEKLVGVVSRDSLMSAVKVKTAFGL